MEERRNTEMTVVDRLRDDESWRYSTELKSVRWNGMEIGLAYKKLDWSWVVL